MKGEKQAIPLIVLLVSAALTVTGQGGSPTIEMSDSAGDVVVEPFGDAPDGFETGTEFVDLLGLTIGPETELAINFELQLASVEQPTSAGNFAKRMVEIGFSFLESEYMITDNDAPCNGYGLSQSQAPPNPQRVVACVESEVDVNSNRILLEVPKSAIKATDGHPISTGESITDIAAGTAAYFLLVPETATSTVNQPRTGIWMHDEIESTGASFELQLGGSPNPDAGFTLSTETPLRSTNGAETTFRFDVRLDSDNAEIQRLTTSVGNAWNGLEVAVNDTFVLPAGESILAPVYASIPFGHIHGETKWFTVTFTDPSLDEAAVIDLGIHWLEIPQPAGHHPVIWFHSTASEIEPSVSGAESQLFSTELLTSWMNAVETDPSPLAVDEPVAGRFSETYVAQLGDAPASDYTWYSQLSPALQLGLAFDPGANGTIELAFDNLFPSGIADVSVALSVCRFDASEPGHSGGCWGQRTALASESLEDLQIDQDGQVEVNLELRISPEIQNISFHPDNNLLIAIELTESPGPTKASGLKPRWIVSESRMTLPLLEYNELSPLSGVPKDDIPATSENVGPEKRGIPAPGSTVIIGLLAAIALSLIRMKHR